jgi:hypothetical protein
VVFEACESVFSGAALVCVNDGAYHIGYCFVGANLASSEEANLERASA